jgi:hypothetical protein
MTTRKNCDRFSTRVFAGLMIAVTVVVGTLAHAVSNVQAYL